MIRLPQRETRLMVAVHGWSGILLGLLLYLVVATGTLAVFAHEIGTWSAGTLDHRPVLERPVDTIVRQLAAQTPEEYREDVSIGGTTSNDLSVFFHTHGTNAAGTPVDVGIMWEVDADGAVLSRVEGDSETLFAPDNDSALERLLVDLHVRLYLPNPWGLLLTGLLGLAMLVAAVSGLLMHRHLIKDIFTLRRRARPVLAARDRHSVAGSWSLPFCFILAFTGSFFSFAGSFGLPALATVAFGGDQIRMFETLVGAPAAEDSRPASGASLDTVLADARARAGTTPVFVSLSHYGRADAEILASHDPAEGALFPRTLAYDGNSGAFEGEKPNLGTVPSAGATAFALMAPLHFGSFAGLLSRAIWFALGFATCFVIVTGLKLWLRRRLERGARLAWLDRLTTTIVWGVPIGVATAATAYFLAMPAGAAVLWTLLGFLIGAILAILAGLLAPDIRRLERVYPVVLAGLLATLPVLRHVAGGPSWPGSLMAGQPLIVAVDLALLAAAAWLARGAVRIGRTRAATPPVAMPAE